MKRRQGLRVVAYLLLAAAPLFFCACGRTSKTPKMEVAEPARAPLLSGVKTMVYHTRDCRYARDIPDAELLGYANPGRAERAGRIPCAVCHPRETFAASDEPLEMEPANKPAAASK